LARTKRAFSSSGGIDLGAQGSERSCVGAPGLVRNGSLDLAFIGRQNCSPIDNARGSIVCIRLSVAH
jgi:hypothetical protein